MDDKWENENDMMNDDDILMISGLMNRQVEMEQKFHAWWEFWVLNMMFDVYISSILSLLTMKDDNWGYR